MAEVHSRIEGRIIPGAVVKTVTGQTIHIHDITGGNYFNPAKVVFSYPEDLDYRRHVSQQSFMEVFSEIVTDSPHYQPIIVEYDVGDVITDGLGERWEITAIKYLDEIEMVCVSDTFHKGQEFTRDNQFVIRCIDFAKTHNQRPALSVC